MNVNLNRAIFGISEADALMFAIERSYLDLDVKPEELERMDRGTHAFYALWDIIKGVADDLNKLQGDSLVVDAIYAAGEVRRRRTLKKED